MSTTTPDNHNVSIESRNEGTFERRSWNYAYIGEDNEGRHHHVDRKLERVVVNESKAENDLPEGAGATVYRVEGPIHHAQAVGQHPKADGYDDGVKIWIDYIESRVGWAHRPVHAADRLQDALTEVL